MSGLTRFLMAEVEMPAVTVTADMEEAGYLIDRGYFIGLRRRLEAEKAEVESEIWRVVKPIVGEAAFDPDSVEQVGDLLFRALGLSPHKLTTVGAPSTDAKTLLLLRQEHEVVPLLLAHRKLAKVIGTYCTIPDHLDEDGRLRVEFDQLGAKTGRFTSRSVIQTLPRDDAWGLRRGFVTPAGHRIVAADYDQQELRILAAVSGDKLMKEAVAAGVDLHGVVAVKVFGLDCRPEEVKARHKDQRDRVKAIQFGIIYGRGPNSLAAELGLPFDDARRLQQDYFRQFPSVKAFIEGVHARVRKDGYVDDVFGRRRHLPDARLQRPRKPYGRMTPEEKAVVGKINAALRAAQNFVIQGPAATVTKLAMIRCHRRIREAYPGVRMILTLHDELHFEAPEPDVDRLAGELPALMCGLQLERFGISVPMAVTIKVGPNWGDLKPFPPREG